ncbi:hypothetical protein NDU88_000811 [Pleurodeles waltl]|uniref:Beta/gamma crystallin 'Greek key' domain-containing protein n=1 Tax=Pleurodeles waltl TaxID=8319 RepID=A0AAV7P1Z2_PLEWA|nr:hypothetical protein NDU88_000811 [Pleurodeles waltl]
MNTITCYELANFQGLQKTFTADVPDLIKENFNDCIASVKIVGQPWVLYEHLYYGGQCLPLEEGEHPELSLINHASSARVITEDLDNPQITLYEHFHAGGYALVLTEEANLSFGSMQDNASSHRVQRGAWALYEHINKTGRCIVARAGEYLANYNDIGFNDHISYAYPLRPGKASVTAKILWDKKKVESENNIQIDQYFYTNNSGIEQEFTAISAKEFEKVVSHSFEFSNESSVRVGTSFTLGDVFTIEGEVSNTFTVTKGENESLTTRKLVELQMPVRAPPHTDMTVSFMCKQVSISVPVELTIVRGGKTKIETGTYRCQSGSETYIDVKGVPIA